MTSPDLSESPGFLTPPSTQVSSSQDGSTLRPRRRTTKTINYKEKTELDIPTVNKPTTTTSSSLNNSKRGGYKRHNKSSSPLNSTSSSESITSSHHSGTNNSQNSIATNSLKDASNYFPVDDVIPLNYQPPITSKNEFNNIIDLRGAKIDHDEVTLTLKNGLKIRKGDCIYMICEPPTEPFYIARIVGFTKKDKNSNTRNAKNYMFSVCWFYRPRDLNRRITDTRLIYASLHRDDCPLTSFRSIVTVKNKSEISDLDDYRNQPNCFYFDKLYDRYMMKMYDMIPTKNLNHLPKYYYLALSKRFEFIFVEVGRADELLSSPKNCEKCLQWCSNSDSIQCLKCEKSYHLLCLDPQILTKPKKGFAWYCAACNKELEDELSAKRGRMLESSLPSQILKTNGNNNAIDPSSSQTLLDESNSDASIKGDNEEEEDVENLKYEQMAKKFLEDDKGLSLKKRREKEEWPYRYLGVHAKLEDALDLQDRPYARASSRLGAKHQCTSLTGWFGRRVQYYDPVLPEKNNKRGRKTNNRGKKSSPSIMNSSINDDFDYDEDKKFPIPEEYKNTKPRDFPKWLQPKPKGYIERGTDETSKLLWKQPEGLENLVDKYIKDCAPIAKSLKLLPNTPNFMDAILKALLKYNYDPILAINEAQKFTLESLKEPTLSPDEVKRFEDSVKINGSELHPVFKDVGTQTSAMVVRFYYLWKKTKNGHLIWDNYPGRPKNRLKNTRNVGLDLDNPDDDGSYSSNKIIRAQVHFECIYCKTNHSNEWFRAPGITLPDTKDETCFGLCYRCARLWRRYGVKWEDPIELLKSQEKRYSYTHKRRVESEMVQDAEDLIKARENYKLNPRKLDIPLKEFKAIDFDEDYTLVTDHSKKRERVKKAEKIEKIDENPPAKKKQRVKKERKSKKLEAKKYSQETETEAEAEYNDNTKIKEEHDDSKAPHNTNTKQKNLKATLPINESRDTKRNNSEIDNSDPKTPHVKKIKISKPKKIFADKVTADAELQLQAQLKVLRSQLDANSTNNENDPKVQEKLRKKLHELEKELEEQLEVAQKQSSLVNLNSDDLSPEIRAMLQAQLDAQVKAQNKVQNNATKLKQKKQSTSVKKAIVFQTKPMLQPNVKAQSIINTKTKQNSAKPETPDYTGMKMISRYESKFGIYNPFTSTEQTIPPLPQTRSAYKELSTLWRAYQFSKKSKQKSSKKFQPLYPANSRGCCICRQLDSTNTVLICTNCGLNVHASCYGIKLPSDIKQANELNWHCDTCSNDLHPIVSTHYVCSLCNARETNMDKAMKGDPESIPDAMKRTVEGRWCHVSCAIMDDNVKFGGDGLQPIHGVPAVGIKNFKEVCSVCTGGGGVINQCRVCERKSHVTCGFDSNWFVGFEICHAGEIEGGDVVEVENIGIGKLRPVTICNDHGDEPHVVDQLKLCGLRAIGKRIVGNKVEELPVIQLYSKDERKRSVELKGGELKSYIFDEMVRLNKENHELLDDPGNMVESIKFCRNCKNDRSLMWYANDNCDGVVCHRCYIRTKNNITVEDVIPDLSNVNVGLIDCASFGINSLNDFAREPKFNRFNLNEFS